MVVYKSRTEGKAAESRLPFRPRAFLDCSGLLWALPSLGLSLHEIDLPSSIPPVYSVSWVPWGFSYLLHQRHP